MADSSSPQSGSPELVQTASLADDRRSYFPRRIGFVSPRADTVYEFLTVADDKAGTFVKILETFSAHFVNLYSSLTYSDFQNGTFVFSAIADFANADRTPNELKREVSTFPFVSHVDFTRVSGSSFETFLFPVTVGRNVRSAVLPVDALMELERSMLALGARGDTAVADTQRPIGIYIAKNLRQYLPWANTEATLAACEEELKALGWGVFKFSCEKSKQGRVKISVHEPIFSDTIGANVSWSIVGLAAGILEGLHDERYVLDGKPNYSHTSREFKFVLQPATTSSEKV